MADLVITAANVVNVDALLDRGTAGETITAGQGVYVDSATNKLMKGDADDAAKRNITGIAMNGGALNQPIVFARSGRINIGATVVPGTFYYQSPVAGGIAPRADVVTLCEVIELCYAVSATDVVINIVKTGVVL